MKNIGGAHTSELPEEGELVEIIRWNGEAAHPCYFAGIEDGRLRFADSKHDDGEMNVFRLIEVQHVVIRRLDRGVSVSERGNRWWCEKCEQFVSREEIDYGCHHLPNCKGQVHRVPNGAVNALEAESAKLKARCERLENAAAFHPRAARLMMLRRNFLVVSEREPYFGHVYSEVRRQEMSDGTWSEDDERAYRFACSPKERVRALTDAALADDSTHNIGEVEK